RIREAAKRQGVPCGLHVNSAQDALRRAAEGWQFIAVGSELRLMLEASANLLKALNPGGNAAELAKY
ncbi:MAG: 2-dehydro-3-deoxyglucarate aldolase, partial [Thermoleophilia bacterium]|nr:2-dehydro-3-deoxyglucarate aldolase [Thermoleophilia bacterium]